MLLDAGKSNRSVWGVVSNAEFWKFKFIDDRGRLWDMGHLTLELDYYNESKVLAVYRMLHHLVKCCYEACTPPSPVAP